MSKKSQRLFNQTRLILLRLFLIEAKPQQAFITREIIKYAGRGNGAVQREIQSLLELNYIICTNSDQRNKLYTANYRNPILSSIKDVVIQELAKPVPVKSGAKKKKRKI